MAKDSGYVLSIDEASNLAGISLWLNGNLIAQVCLKATKKFSYSRRLQELTDQLNDFLNSSLPPDVVIEKVVMEGVRSRTVQMVCGAFLTCKRIDAELKGAFVETPSWKRWAKDHGATQPFHEIKGVFALREVGFPVDDHAIVSDDVADSCLQLLCWKEAS